MMGSTPMSADASNFFISILDNKIDTLRVQLRSEEEPLSLKIQGQLAVALRIRERIQPTAASERAKKPIDALAEWCRWERDALDFEPRR